MPFFLALCALSLPAQDYDQSKVPLEALSDDASLAKVVLLAGKASHGPGDHEYFAGMALLMKMLRQNPGVWPVMARDGWPKNPEILKGAKSIVVFSDGGGKHPLLRDDRMDVVGREIEKGAGFCCIHYGINFPKQVSERIRGWLGGHILGGYSASLATKWTAEFKELPEHPATRGVPPFTLHDEWYYNALFADGMKGVTPLLRAVPPEKTRNSAEAKKHPGRAEIVAWAFERAGGGRGFGYTGGHMHRNWGDANARRIVVNGILWTARVEVPAGGAKVELDPAELEKNLDDKRKKKR